MYTADYTPQFPGCNARALISILTQGPGYQLSWEFVCQYVHTCVFHHHNQVDTYCVCKTEEVLRFHHYFYISIPPPLHYQVVYCRHITHSKHCSSIEQELVYCNLLQ